MELVSAEERAPIGLGTARAAGRSDGPSIPLPALHVQVGRVAQSTVAAVGWKLMKPVGRQASGIVFAGLLLLIGIPGCGGEERSVESFCRVWKKEATELHDRYQASADAAAADQSGLGALNALGSLAGVTTELGILFTKLEKVAPDDIRVEVTEIRDALKNQTEANPGLAGDPVGTIGGSFLRMMQISGPLARVDAYILEHCGAPPYS